MNEAEDMTIERSVIRNLDLPVYCIKCENEIKRVDLEEGREDEFKKGEYVNDILDFDSGGCIGKSISPGILVELINPSEASFSTEEEATFHGYMCDGCLKELQDKKIIEQGPDEDKKAFLYCKF